MIIECNAYSMNKTLHCVQCFDSCLFKISFSTDFQFHNTHTSLSHMNVRARVRSTVRVPRCVRLFFTHSSLFSVRCFLIHCLLFSFVHFLETECVYTKHYSDIYIFSVYISFFSFICLFVLFDISWSSTVVEPVVKVPFSHVFVQSVYSVANL